MAMIGDALTVDPKKYRSTGGPGQEKIECGSSYGSSLPAGVEVVWAS